MIYAGVGGVNYQPKTKPRPMPPISVWRRGFCRGGIEVIQVCYGV